MRDRIREMSLIQPRSEGIGQRRYARTVTVAELELANLKGNQ